MKPKQCPVCHKTKSKSGKDFDRTSLRSHVYSVHPELAEKIYPRRYPTDDYYDSALEMADLLAGDESDGVYWGIAYEHGYFG